MVPSQIEKMNQLTGLKMFVLNQQDLRHPSSTLVEEFAGPTF